MTRYISNPDNLKLMMNMLKEKSRNIQFEAFHVFKVGQSAKSSRAGLQDCIKINSTRERHNDYYTKIIQVSRIQMKNKSLSPLVFGWLSKISMISLKGSENNRIHHHAIAFESG